MATTHNIPTVADTTARDALFPVPITGQLCYRIDVARIEVWTGSAWALVGGRQMIDGYFQDNVPASQAATESSRSAGRWASPRAGSVTGIGVQMAPNQARTAGTLTAEAWIAAINPTTGARTETATGLTAVLNASNAVFKATTQAKDLDTFIAGSEIFVKVATDGSWTPTTGDIRTYVEVET